MGIGIQCLCAPLFCRHTPFVRLLLLQDGAVASHFLSLTETINRRPALQTVVENFVI